MEIHFSILPKVKQLLRGQRFIVSDEKQLQEQLFKLFSSSIELLGIQKEYSLGENGRVDFWVAGAAIEVKTKGSPMAIYRQLKIYAAHESVKEIILITAKSMTLPVSINNKPAGFINISKAWL